MKIINENGDPDFEFTSALMKLLGIEEDQVAEVIENLEVDDLTDLVDACVRGDVADAKRIIGSETEEDEPEADNIDGDPHEIMAKRLFAPKGKAPQETAKKARILRNSELGEDQNSIVSFGIGDDVAVNGHEATIKIPSAAGDTVGVMINGELRMVDKKNVHPMKEGVLGMTGMPGLKPNSDLQRIRELAGMRDAGDSFDAPEPAEFPGQAPMTPPLETDEPLDMGDAHEVPMAPETEMPATNPMAMPGEDMGDDMGGEEDFGMDAPEMEPEAPMGELSAPEGMPSPGSALEDAAALDQAISEIENMIPNVKISEYKTLVARLKALVSMAESAGKAALTEGRSIAQRQGRVEHEVEEGSLPFGMSPDYQSKTKPKAFDGEQAKFKAPSELTKRIAAFATNRRQNAKVGEDRMVPKEDKLAVKKEPAAKQEEEGARKTLMDYVREADEGMETIGMDRNGALKAIQARMGPAASPQQANQAFDAMFASGHVKQQNGRFVMPAMSDEDFHMQMAQTAQSTATGGMSNATATATPANTSATTGQNTTGQNTTNPGANVQGASNSAYQGR